MPEQINYRFFSSKNYTALDIHGNSLPLWEFRAEVIQHNKMVSNDFELLFFDDEDVPITDDYYVIHRNSNITIKRIPIWMSRTYKPGVVTQTSTKANEKELNPVLSAELNSLRYKAQTKSMPTYTGYVCFRCGQKGHFIQFCPTNLDKNYDFVKLRKPTGIPKAFLKQINEDQEKENLKGLMVTEKGLVKAEPQIEEWNKLKGSNVDIPDHLKCKVCNFLYTNPIKINCGHVFCEDCISAKERCLFCEKKIFEILEDHEMRVKIDTYLDKNN